MQTRRASGPNKLFYGYAGNLIKSVKANNMKMEENMTEDMAKKDGESKI